MNDKDHISSLLRIIESLKKSRKQWINNYSEASKENQQLKERIDKAIEKVDILRKAYERNISPIPCTEIEIIDKVLKGEDNNE
jgi:regulator of replication initiation timing